MTAQEYLDKARVIFAEILVRSKRAEERLMWAQAGLLAIELYRIARAEEMDEAHRLRTSTIPEMKKAFGLADE